MPRAQEQERLTTVRKVYGVRNDGVEAYVIYHSYIGIHFCVIT